MWGLHTYCRPYLLLRPLQRVACYFREGRKHSRQEERKLMIDLKIHQFQNLQVYYSDFSAKLLATLVWILTWWSFWRFDRYSWWHCRSQGIWPMCVRVWGLQMKMKTFLWNMACLSEQALWRFYEFFQPLYQSWELQYCLGMTCDTKADNCYSCIQHFMGLLKKKVNLFCLGIQ